MRWERVEVLVVGGSQEARDKVRPVIDRALIAAGFAPVQEERHLSVVPSTEPEEKQ
jgi:hypothetical protein